MKFTDIEEKFTMYLNCMEFYVASVDPSKNQGSRESWYNHLTLMRWMYEACVDIVVSFGALSKQFTSLSPEESSQLERYQILLLRQMIRFKIELATRFSNDAELMGFIEVH